MSSLPEPLLHGPLVASADANQDHCEEAWGGKYPYQVPIQLDSSGVFQITKEEFEEFIPFESVGVPFVAVSNERAGRLLEMLRSGKPSNLFKA